MAYIDDAFREMDDRGRSKLDRIWEEHIKEFPPGSLSLPPLLEQKRLEHKLAEGFFRFECLWDYVLVAQISYDDEVDKLLSGSKLVRPQAYEDAAKRTSYLGVLVSAGSTALDKLESEGVTLGHTIRFMRYTPFQCQVDCLVANGESANFYGVDLVVSDIRGSLELAEGLRKGDVHRNVIRHDNGSREHVYVDEHGEIWHPEVPTVEDNWA